MTSSQGPTVPASSTETGADRSRHWRVVALVVAAVSGVMLFVGGTAGPALLASLGMMVAVGHLLIARPWQRAQPHSGDERQP